MNNLKKYREEKKISIAELAYEIGKSERHLRFIEKGERTPSLPVARKIAHILEKNVDDIFE